MDSKMLDRLELSEAKAEGDNGNFTDDDELRISVEEVSYPDTAPSTPEGTDDAT